MEKNIDIKIAFNCNNNCDFCAQGNKEQIYKTKDEIEKILIKAKQKGIKEVVFTGGEPTLHKDIIEIVRLAKKLDYKAIQLQTNGRKLCDYNFCKVLKDAGVTEISPSIHSSNYLIHNRLTNSNSFSQVIKGITNAKKIGFKVITNTVINSLNYTDLPKLANLLCYLKVDQFQFAFIHIIGTAWENREWIVPKKSEIMPYVYKALDIGIKNKVLCYTEAIPYCFMIGYEDHIAENIIPDGPVIDANFYLDSYTDYRYSKGKIKGKKCISCVYNSICEGPWREYVELYGWSEFKLIRFRRKYERV